ncbi:MAG: hypothetical protein WAX44_00255 [Minisyncoccia bacterium]
MVFLLTIPNYFLWHYSKALFDLVNLWRNFTIFFYDFFSIPTLLKTLFSPWHRMNDAYSGQLTFEATVGTFIVNTLMRIVGGLVRGVFVVLGLISIIVSFSVGLIVFCAWLLLPLILLYTFLSGIKFLTI